MLLNVACKPDRWWGLAMHKSVVAENQYKLSTDVSRSVKSKSRVRDRKRLRRHEISSQSSRSAIGDIPRDAQARPILMAELDKA